MKTRLTAALAAFALALSLSACGGSNTLSTQGKSSPGAEPAGLPTIAVSKELADQVPAKFKTAGILQIGTDPTYKPIEYLDGDKVVGFDVDVIDMAAAKLGLKTKWNPSQFDAILIGIEAGKYDLGVSSLTINAKRLASVNMVSYAMIGTQWATPPGNPKKVDPKNPCGHTIAVQTGTIQEDEMKAAQEKCPADKKINLLSYTGQDEANTALASGKAEAMLADFPVIVSAIEATNGKVEKLGEQYEAAPYGIAMQKDNKELADLMALALAEVKKDGGYDAVLKKYAMEAVALEKFEVNPQVAG